MSDCVPIYQGLASFARERKVDQQASPRLNPEPEHVSDSLPTSTEMSLQAAAGPSDDPDARDAARAQRGDRDAMEVLVLRHQPAVSRLLWRFVVSPSDLDDLVQETFLRMVRGLPNWRAKQPFLHWLLRIATNTGRDYFRRQTVRRRWQAESTLSKDDHAGSLPEAVDTTLDPASRAAANEVKAILAHLPPDDRALLTLHHLEGWGLGVIAKQFGWTVTATKLRAWRARRRLRALIETAKLP